MSRTSTTDAEKAPRIGYQAVLLGAFALFVNGRPLKTVTAPKLQSLLAYLFLHANRQLDRSFLASIFWPELSEEVARGHLRKTLFKLKECLPTGETPLELSKTCIQWLGTTQTDVQEIEALLQTPLTLESVLRIQERYTGDLLPECPDAWCSQMRQSLRDRVLSAFDSLAATLEARGQYGDGLGIVQKRLRVDPTHEESWYRLFRLNRAVGDRASALQAWKDWDAQGLRTPSGAQSEAFRRAAAQLANEPTRLGVETPHLPLIGRVAELTTLQTAWHQVMQGNAMLGILSGVAGIGKSRLAEALETSLTSQGHRVVGTSCTQSEKHSAYAVLAMLLRSLPTPDGPPARLAELARLLPEVGERSTPLPPVQSLTEPGQRQRFFQVLAKFLLEHEPMLLIIDDIQWCDDATLEFIQHCFRAHPSRKLFWLATFRSDDDPSPGLLQRELLPTLRRAQRVVEVGLVPLSPQDSYALLRAEAREGLPMHVMEGLNVEAEGTPLYLLELFRARHLGEGVPLMAGLYPQTLTEAVAMRASQLTPGARQIVDILSVVEGPASSEMLAEVTGRSELETVQDLEALIRRRLVVERLDASFRFSHGLVGAIVYQLLSLARRRTLHRCVAEVLARRAGVGTEQDLVIAVQFEKGGQPEKAAEHYVHAGTRAARLGDLSTARSTLERGLAFPGLTSSLRLSGLEQMVQISTMLGDHAVGMHSVDLILSLADPHKDGRAYSLALIHRAYLLQRVGRHSEADEPLARASTLLAALSPGPGLTPQALELTRLQAHIQRAELALRRLRLDTIRADATQACTSYAQLAASTLEPGVHISGGMTLLWIGQRSRSTAATETALRLASSQERKEWESVARYWRAFSHQFDGHKTEAESEFRLAISLAQQAGSSGHLPFFEQGLGGLLALQGRLREALSVLGVGAETQTEAPPEGQRHGAEAAFCRSFFGEYDAAKTLGSAAAAKTRAAGQLWRSWRWLARLCSVALFHHRLDDAELWLDESERLLPELLRAPGAGREKLDSVDSSMPSCVVDLRLMSLYNRGVYLLANGQARAAVVHLEEAAALRASSLLQAFEWDPHFALAEALLRLDAPGLAKAVLEQVASATRDAPLCRSGLARFYALRWQTARAQHDDASARSAFRSAREALERQAKELNTEAERDRLFTLPCNTILLDPRG